MDSTLRTPRDSSNPTHSTSGMRLSDGSGNHSLARGLGWMSIGLGALELWKHRELGETLGTGGEGGIYQLYGLREIGTGLGLLMAKDPTPWVWARVAGDILDMATLAPELRPENTQRKAAAVAAAVVAGAALADLACVLKETRETRWQKQMELPRGYHPELGH